MLWQYLQQACSRSQSCFLPWLMSSMSLRSSSVLMRLRVTVRSRRSSSCSYNCLLQAFWNQRFDIKELLDMDGSGKGSPLGLLLQLGQVPFAVGLHLGPYHALRLAGKSAHLPLLPLDPGHRVHPGGGRRARESVALGLVEGQLRRGGLLFDVLPAVLLLVGLGLSLRVLVAQQRPRGVVLGVSLPVGEPGLGEDNGHVGGPPVRRLAIVVASAVLVVLGGGRQLVGHAGLVERGDVAALLLLLGGLELELGVNEVLAVVTVEGDLGAVLVRIVGQRVDYGLGLAEFVLDCNPVPVLLPGPAAFLVFVHVVIMQDSRDIRVYVAVRVRPSLTREGSFLRCKDKLVVLVESETEDSRKQKKESREQHYEFDAVFGEESTQLQVFQYCRPYVQQFIEGYNATILAYGATGSGKTYTMLGNGDELGVMQRAAQHLFSQKNGKLAYKVSFVQVYNETIRDLIGSEDKQLQLRQDPKVGVNLIGATQLKLNSVADLNAVLKIGMRNRTKEATLFNEASSRSHGVLLVQMERKENEGLLERLTNSRLCLVDLAGSQKAGNNKGQRLIEGGKINQSLLTLGNCIQALAQSSGKSEKPGFVPFRASKLTRLLKDSLGGNCRTLMLSTVVCDRYGFEQTRNTLLYSSRARAIKSTLFKNVVNVQNHVSNYLHILEDLKRENVELKQKGAQTPKASLMSQDLERAKVLEGQIQRHFSREKEILLQCSKNVLQLQIKKVRAIASAELKSAPGSKGGQEQRQKVQLERKHLLEEIEAIGTHVLRIQLLTKYSHAKAGLERLQIEETQHRMKKLGQFQDQVIKELKGQLKPKEAEEHHQPKKSRVGGNSLVERSRRTKLSTEKTGPLPLIKLSDLTESAQIRVRLSPLPTIDRYSSINQSPPSRAQDSSKRARIARQTTAKSIERRRKSILERKVKVVNYESYKFELHKD